MEAASGGAAVAGGFAGAGLTGVAFRGGGAIVVSEPGGRAGAAGRAGPALCGNTGDCGAMGLAGDSLRCGAGARFITGGVPVIDVNRTAGAPAFMGGMACPGAAARTGGRAPGTMPAGRGALGFSAGGCVGGVCVGVGWPGAAARREIAGWTGAGFFTSGVVSGSAGELLSLSFIYALGKSIATEADNRIEISQWHRLIQPLIDCLSSG